MDLDTVDFQRLTPELETPLAQFFADFDAAGDARWFHPHAFTPDEAHRRATYRGDDRYYAMVREGLVVGYGMLRGWDEGFDVPSLGIALHPQARRSGLGRRFMNFLHQEALARGAHSIRLKVYPDNVGAVHLYASLGYRFDSHEQGQLVGVVRLSQLTSEEPADRPPSSARNPLAASVTAEALLKRLRNAVARGDRSARIWEASGSTRAEPAAAEGARERDVRHLPQIVDDNAFIYELYRVVLQRRPDLSGFKHYRGLLARGLPKTFIVYEIATSDEVLSRNLALEGVWRPKPVAEILALDGVAFVREAYRSLLWREADVAGIEHGCLELKSGVTKWSLLTEIARSREARMLPQVSEGIEALTGSSESGGGSTGDEPDLNALIAGSAEGFVEYAHRTTFGRDPEPATIADGLIALAGGMSRQAWLRRLLEPNEVRTMESTASVRA